MRIATILMFVVFAVAAMSAQITLTTTDMPVVGVNAYSGVDTLAGWVNVGPKGANVTWDFSQAVRHRTDTTFVKSPSNTPCSSQFSGSTHALTANNDDYLFFQNSAAAYKATGLAGDLLDNGNTVDVQFSPAPPLYQFPTQYGNTFGGTYGFTKTVSGSSVGQPVDQVRLTYTATYWDTIDAWGTVITPVGSYNALRQHRVEQTYTKIEVKFLSISPWSTFDEIYDTTNSYTWLAKESKSILVSLGRDSLKNIKTLSYSLIPPAPVADFSYTNPSGGVTDFTDLSTNSPTSWSWDFGDGGTSTQRNPTHIYAANNTYTVCLIAGNSTGSDTVCQQVNITNILPNNAPVARNDTASTTAPANVSIPVLNNDTEPDGDPTTLTIITQPANGTASVSGNNIVYTPSASFSGQDSLQYSVCDDGNPAPVLCDSAWVYITVNANPTQASFVVVSDDSCGVTLANTSTNYSGLVSWTFGDGGTALGDTVSHTYATAGDYTVCVSVISNSVTYTKCDTLTITCPVGIEGIDGGVFSVYPNPANDKLVVEVTAPVSYIGLFNLLGEQVLGAEASGSGATQLNLANLQQGLYLVRVQAGGQWLPGSERVIIAR